MAERATCSVPKPLPPLTSGSGPALPGMAQLSGCRLPKRKPLSVRAQAWVAGLVPCLGGLQEQPVSVSLSCRCLSPPLSLSLPPTLEINKTLKKKICPKAREYIEAPVEDKEPSPSEPSHQEQTIRKYNEKRERSSELTQKHAKPPRSKLSPETTQLSEERPTLDPHPGHRGGDLHPR